MKRSAAALLVVLVTGAIALPGHRWLLLGWNAARYPTAIPTERTQAVLWNDRAYIAAGADGIDVVPLGATSAVARIAPISPIDRVDDLAVADGWLFALDATPPGHLRVYSLAHPDQPTPLGTALAVPVGPFSGVSAAAGRVGVSGGTSSLTLGRYDNAGRLGNQVATADLGRGQPDLALRPDGRLAAVSTHRFGPDFGMSFVALDGPKPHLLGFVPLRAAGFSAGGYKPAHFPLVPAWQANRVYVAHGGGLAVIDATHPEAPRLIGIDPESRPAIDVAICNATLVVLRAGRRPALLRYRVAPGNDMPRRIDVTPFPDDSEPGALACSAHARLVTFRAGDWRWLPGTAPDSQAPPEAPLPPNKEQ